MTKKVKSILLGVMSGAMLIVAILSMSSGSVYAQNSIEIRTCTELQAMQYGAGLNYVLASDIDCSDTKNWNSGTGFVPIGPFDSSSFTGTFDGQNHKITGLLINRPSTSDVGLFGYIGIGAIIKNVGLANVSITGNNHVGGLVGWNYQGTITNSYATGSITGNNCVGGLVGGNSGTITNSYATGSVSVSDNSGYGGGLVGWNNGGAITNSYATGSITGVDTLGGLVGYNNYGGTITNSYATGSVTGTGNLGGLVGQNYQGTITNSYATGNIKGNYSVGGLVGNNSGTIINSYATGSVTGSSGGGLVGGNYGAITNSYWDTETSGQSTSAGGTEKTTAEMKQQSTYVNWDFVSIWAIDKGYPYLRWQIPPISLNLPNGGESWTAGTSKNITWTSGSVTDVKLEYTTDNGANWTTIVESTAASAGSYSWTVPNTPSSQCLVRVSNTTNAVVSDKSDAIFSIMPVSSLITELITKVNGLVTSGVLNKGNGNALTVKLEGALDDCNKGNYSVAVNHLGAFINQVEAFRGKKLTIAKADELILDAQNIIQIIGRQNWF